MSVFSKYIFSRSEYFLYIQRQFEEEEYQKEEDELDFYCENAIDYPVFSGRRKQIRKEKVDKKEQRRIKRVIRK